LLLFCSYFYLISFSNSRSRFSVSSGIPEADHKHSRRNPEESTEKPEGMGPFPEALPKAATLFGLFYDGNKLFFIVYELIIKGLAGVAPPPPPLSYLWVM
jgi:hypothetical protein